MSWFYGENLRLTNVNITGSLKPYWQSFYGGGSDQQIKIYNHLQELAIIEGLKESGIEAT